MMKKSKSGRIMRDFISDDNRNYKVRIGSTIASSLSGVICGAILASIVWFVALKYIISMMGGICIK